MRIRRIGATPKVGQFPKKVLTPKTKAPKEPTPGFSNVMDQAKQTAGFKSRLRPTGRGTYEVEKISMTLREFTKLALFGFGKDPKRKQLEDYLAHELAVKRVADHLRASGHKVVLAPQHAYLDKKAAEEKENKGVPSEKAVQDFLDKHPNPTDAQFHAFTDKHKFNTHKAEAIAYRLAAKQVKFIRGGKSNEPGPKHYDSKQMKAGIEVEAEHTPDMESRKKISRDHLAEFANYYIPHLRDLEAKLKAKKRGG